MIEIALRAKIAEVLTAHGLTARVAPSADKSVTELPRLLYSRIGGERTYHSKGPVGIAQARFQLDIFAPTLLDAASIATALLKPATPTDEEDDAGLDFYSGTVDDVEILLVTFPDGPREGPSQQSPGMETAPARLLLETVVTYREP